MVWLSGKEFTWNLACVRKIGHEGTVHFSDGTIEDGSEDFDEETVETCMNEIIPAQPGTQLVIVDGERVLQRIPVVAWLIEQRRPLMPPEPITTLGRIDNSGNHDQYELLMTPDGVYTADIGPSATYKGTFGCLEDALAFCRGRSP